MCNPHVTRVCVCVYVNRASDHYCRNDIWLWLSVGFAACSLCVTDCSVNNTLLGGNSLNYSPALIGLLSGDCTGFLPTAMLCEGSLSSTELNLMHNDHICSNNNLSAYSVVFPTMTTNAFLSVTQCLF